MSTTNMEAQRGVIWDIGAIANSGNPHALDLIHKIMLASASIPGMFQPVFIDVESGGPRHIPKFMRMGALHRRFLSIR
jgi:predicted acylesterase/phospholipase RssA